jgi:hypothetical protein
MHASYGIPGNWLKAVGTSNSGQASFRPKSNVLPFDVEMAFETECNEEYIFQPAVVRRGDNQTAAETEQPGEFGEHSVYIINVFNHLGRPDRIKRLFFKGDTVAVQFDEIQMRKVSAIEIDGEWGKIDTGGTEAERSKVLSELATTATIVEYFAA